MPAAVPLSYEQKVIAYQLREYRRMADEAREKGRTHALEYFETRIAQLELVEQRTSASPARGSGPIIVGGNRG